MSARAKLFKNGGSQAVRLPKDCRFPETQTEVAVRREGSRIVLEPVDAWPEEFLACVGAWTGEIPRPKRDPRAAPPSGGSRRRSRRRAPRSGRSTR